MAILSLPSASSQALLTTQAGLVWRLLARAALLGGWEMWQEYLDTELELGQHQPGSTVIQIEDQPVSLVDILIGRTRSQEAADQLSRLFVQGLGFFLEALPTGERIRSAPRIARLLHEVQQHTRLRPFTSLEDIPEADQASIWDAVLRTIAALDGAGEPLSDWMAHVRSLPVALHSRWQAQIETLALTSGTNEQIGRLLGWGAGVASELAARTEPEGEEDGIDVVIEIREPFESPGPSSPPGGETDLAPPMVPRLLDASGTPGTPSRPIVIPRVARPAAPAVFSRRDGESVPPDVDTMALSRRPPPSTTSTPIEAHAPTPPDEPVSPSRVDEMAAEPKARPAGRPAVPVPDLSLDHDRVPPEVEPSRKVIVQADIMEPLVLTPLQPEKEAASSKPEPEEMEPEGEAPPTQPEEVEPEGEAPPAQPETEREVAHAQPEEVEPEGEASPVQPEEVEPEREVAPAQPEKAMPPAAVRLRRAVPPPIVETEKVSPPPLPEAAISAPSALVESESAVPSGTRESEATAKSAPIGEVPFLHREVTEPGSPGVEPMGRPMSVKEGPDHPPVIKRVAGEDLVLVGTYAGRPWPRVFRILSVVTGLIVLVVIIRVLLRFLLGIRRTGRIWLEDDRVFVETSRHLLGWEVRRIRRAFGPRGILAVEQEVRYPFIHLFIGLFALCAGTLVGTMVYLDGRLAGFEEWMEVGLYLVLGGLIVDFVFTVLAATRPGRTTLSITFEPRTTIRLIGVDQVAAEKLLDQLARTAQVDERLLPELRHSPERH